MKRNEYNVCLCNLGMPLLFIFSFTVKGDEPE